MAVTTARGTRSPTRLLNTHQRVTPVVVITGMRRCETPQTLLHQIKCCDDLTALKTNIVTTLDTVKLKACILTELERGTVGPVILHKKILITTVLCIVQIHTLLILAIIQARLLMHPMIQQMTGLNTLVLLAKSTTIIVEQKFHSGKNRKNGWKENRDKKKQAKCLSTVFQKTGITDER